MATLVERSQEYFFRCSDYAERISELFDTVKKEELSGDSSRLKAILETMNKIHADYIEDHKSGIDLLQRSTSESRIDELKKQQRSYSKFSRMFDEAIVCIKAALIDLEEDTTRLNVPTSSNKIPKIDFRAFDVEDPELWFTQLELQLEAQGVLEDRKRFFALCRLLGQEQADIVGAISIKPPAKP